MKNAIKLYPSDSNVHEVYTKGDFLDYFLLEHPIAQNVTTDELGAAMMKATPKWFNFLFWLRNKIVSIFGLVSETDGKQKGIFPIILHNENETVYGFDDKHLNFRIYIRHTQDGSSLGTWVHPHNIFGRIYLAIVMPFHHMISKHWKNHLEIASKE